MLNTTVDAAHGLCSTAWEQAQAVQHCDGTARYIFEDWADRNMMHVLRAWNLFSQVLETMA